MRRFTLFVIIVALIAGGWWVWKYREDFHGYFEQTNPVDRVTTLEATVSPDAIVAQNPQDFSQEEAELVPLLQFYPYLLLNISYNGADGFARKGVLLWGLNDGEVVLNTDTWETSKGLHECVEAGACKNDFQLLKAIMKNGGQANIEQLAEILPVDKETIKQWVVTSLRKRLIVQRGDEYSLFIQDAKIAEYPETSSNQLLETKKKARTERIPAQFTPQEVIDLAKEAYGNTFEIEKVEVVYLPVYQFTIDQKGKKKTSLWNGINGKPYHASTTGS